MADSAPAGILNLDKPKGVTSHDVVAAVRRMLHVRRVGHAGTLDPLATGVLLLCIGQATRISEYLIHQRKTYAAEVHFGVATDTYDAEGMVTSEASLDGLTEQCLEQTLATFVGPIEQQAPPFSAIKQDGQPLYKKARRGEEVVPPLRQVEIYRADLVRWEPPVATIEVECSSGTYIRSLAHDWGKAVGVGAHLSGLVRHAIGRFTLDDAISLDELRDAAAEGSWEEYRLPMDEALLDFDAVIVTSEEAQALRHGQAIGRAAGADGQLVRAYTMAGAFLALVRFDARSGAWRPHKVFGVD